VKLNVQRANPKEKSQEELSDNSCYLSCKALVGHHEFTASFRPVVQIGIFFRKIEWKKQCISDRMLGLAMKYIAWV
jgi:hypothetical protein